MIIFSGCVWFVYQCFSGLRHWRCGNQALILIPIDHSALLLLYAYLTPSHRTDPELGFIVYVMMTGWHGKNFRIICPLWKNLSITGGFPSQKPTNTKFSPDSRVHGPTWGPPVPCRPLVDPINISIWVIFFSTVSLDKLLDKHSVVGDFGVRWLTSLWGHCNVVLNIIICLFFSRTPLHWAAATGQAAAVSALLELNANPDPRDCEDGTPLHYAQHSGHMGEFIQYCRDKTTAMWQYFEMYFCDRILFYFYSSFTDKC